MLQFLLQLCGRGVYVTVVRRQKPFCFDRAGKSRGKMAYEGKQTCNKIKACKHWIDQLQSIWLVKLNLLILAYCCCNCSLNLRICEKRKATCRWKDSKDLFNALHVEIKSFQIIPRVYFNLKHYNELKFIINFYSTCISLNEKPHKHAVWTNKA